MASAAVATSPPIRDVSVSPPFFSPSLNQSATIHFAAGVRGTATVKILDRDRFPVRTLAPVAVHPGIVTVRWDGRDDSGAIVPDEAWNLRIELGGAVYDPSLDFIPLTEDPQPRTYSRTEGILAYKLTRPSRVHIEAGQARPNAKKQRTEGPILKTIVNREPRVAGAVIESWNGFDESGAIRVCDLPDFVVSVLATSLPDNSILTRGNRKESFLQYAARRRPASALHAKKRAAPTHHHSGLNAFEDRSPDLDVKRSWTSAGALRLEVRVEGPSAQHFLLQPGGLSIYLDDKQVIAKDKPSSPLILTIPPELLGTRERRVVVNWDSDFGPGATSSFLATAPRKEAAR